MAKATCSEHTRHRVACPNCLTVEMERIRHDHFPEYVLGQWRDEVRDLQLRDELHGDWEAGMRPRLMPQDPVMYVLARSEYADGQQWVRWRVELTGEDQQAILRAAANVDLAYI